MKAIKIITISVFALILTACAANNNSIYYWGSYSATAYKLKSEPTAETRGQHKAELQNIIAQADAKNKRIPPGIYAELAMLEAEDNNVSAALQYFEQEKQLFPESSKIIELMQSSLRKEVKQ